jgi:hypothetical protein
MKANLAFWKIHRPQFPLQVWEHKDGARGDYQAECYYKEQLDQFLNKAWRANPQAEFLLVPLDSPQ